MKKIVNNLDQPIGIYIKKEDGKWKSIIIQPKGEIELEESLINESRSLNSLIERKLLTITNVNKFKK